GMGLWGLTSDGRARGAFAGSGLGAASAVPVVPSILPLPLLAGPEDPSERVDALCASVHRLAEYEPSGIVCLTGSGLGREPDAARAVVVDGLRTLAGEAERAGVRIALEPYQREGGSEWTIAPTIQH